MFMHYTVWLWCNLPVIMWILICKHFFIGTLAILFFLYFGYPSYTRFMDGDTLITEEKVRFNPVKPPAITVVAWITEFMKGWKDGSTNASN